jgi:alpha-galactosidase
MAPERDSEGNYQADPHKFPSGMKAMGNYLHNHGLLYGIYTSAGTKTCQGLPGSLGFEERDAQTFTEWGIDYLKYDNCYNEAIPSIDRYPKMRDALNATKRPIFYSLCQWGVEDVWKWAPAVGNSWRSTGDISPHWNSIKLNFLSSQKHIHRNQHGAWADPDMLEVGNGNLTHDEEWTHFALWALVKAPLLLGMDLSTAGWLQIAPHPVDIRLTPLSFRQA